MLERKTLQRWSYAAVGVGGALALLYLPQLLLSEPRAGGDPAFALARAVSVVLATAWAVYFSLVGFRKADEYNRERSKFAWYWGSFIGIVACGPIVAVIHLHWIPGVVPLSPTDHDQFRIFKAGVALPILAQMLGFVVVNLWWKATKR